MTDLGVDLDRLLELAAAATKGPWKAANGSHVYPDRTITFDPDTGYMRGNEGVVADTGYGHANGDADARFIAAADPGTVSELIRRLRAAEAGGLDAQTEDLLAALDRRNVQSAGDLERYDELGLDIKRLAVAVMRASLNGWGGEDGVPVERWDLYAGTVAKVLAREYAAALRESSDV